MNPEQILADVFVANHPGDAARCLEDLQPSQGAAILSRSSARTAAGALKDMDPSIAVALIRDLADEAVPDILTELSPGRAALFLRLVEPSERERLLAGLPEELARSLRLTVSQPEETAGALMDPAVLAVPAKMTAYEAIQRVRSRSEQAHSYLYIVDDARRPAGVLNPRELMLAPRKALLSSIMRSPVVWIPARAGLDAVLAHPGWRELQALPVVDREEALVGVLRREAVEGLKDRFAANRGQQPEGLGVALMEMCWRLAATLVDEVAAAVRSRRADGGRGDDV